MQFFRNRVMSKERYTLPPVTDIVPEKTSDSPSDWNNNCRGATYNLKSITTYLHWPKMEAE
jgi:hypothetical protein